MIGNRGFPDDHWNDFVLVLLAWWVKAVEAGESNDRSVFDLKFMDGPFSVDVKQNFGECEIFGKNSFSNQAETDSENVSLNEIKAEVFAAARKALDICDENDWKTEEYFDLVSLIKKN